MSFPDQYDVMDINMRQREKIVALESRIELLEEVLQLVYAGLERPQQERSRNEMKMRIGEVIDVWSES